MMTAWGRCTAIVTFQYPKILCVPYFKSDPDVLRRFIVWMACSGECVCARVCRTLERVNAVCLFVCVFVSFSKKPTQWSYLIRSELGSAPIGDDRKPAREPPWRWAAGVYVPGPPHFMLWSEVMSWSDILVLAAVWARLKLHDGQWV